MEIMAHGQSAGGWHLDTAEFRELFDRRAPSWRPVGTRSVLASKQSAEVALVKRHRRTPRAFVRNAGNVEPVGRLGLDSRLTQLQGRGHWSLAVLPEDAERNPRTSGELRLSGPLDRLRDWRWLSLSRPVTVGRACLRRPRLSTDPSESVEGMPQT